MINQKIHTTAIDIQQNCMDWMRLFAALSVILSHSLLWLSLPNTPLVRQINIFPGLMIFFAMSGFLITASMERKLSPWPQFLWRRFVRLYPGMWAALLVSIAVVVPTVHAYGIEVELFSWVKWVLAQLTFFQFYTPADLKAYGIGNPNGVLWMIPLLLCMYVLMRLVYPWLRRAGMTAWLLFLAAWVGVAVLADKIGVFLTLIYFKLLFVSFLPYAYIFFIGMFLCRFRERLLPRLCRFWWLLILIYITWIRCRSFCPFTVPGLYLDVFSGCLMSLLSVSVAYRFPLPRLKHDYSYALFLYHEIFINLFVVWGFTQSWLVVAILYACTIPCAIISCHLIEEPATKWLKRVPFLN